MRLGCSLKHINTGGCANVSASVNSGPIMMSFIGRRCVISGSIE